MLFGSEEYWLDQSKSNPAKAAEAIKQLPSVNLWCLYIESVVQADPAALKAEYEKGVEQTQCFIDSSSVFWEKYRSFLESNYPQELHSAFLSRLSVPHLELDATFTQYSDFVKSSGLDYEQSLATASQIIERSKRLIYNREYWEHRVVNSLGAAKLTTLTEYLGWELQQNNRGSFDFSRGLFERILMISPNNEDLWLKYVRYYWVDRIPNSKIKTPADTQLAFQLVDRALFCLPKSYKLSATKMRLFTSMEAAIEFFGQCESAGIHHEELVLQFLYSVKELFKEHGLDAESLHTVFEEHVKSLKVLLYASNMMKDLDLAFTVRLLERHCEEYSGEIQFWHQALLISRESALSWYKKLQSSTGLCIEFMEQRLLLEVFSSGVPQEIEKTLSLRRAWTNNPKKHKIAPVEQNAPASASKTTSDRDREHLSIVVKGKISIEELKSLLESLTVVSVTDGEPRLIELQTKSEKILALSRINFAKGFDLQAYDADNTTLWINNFPSDWHDSELRRAFSVYGTILSLRSPSSEKRSSRSRFCYIQYSTAKEAAAAVQALDGKDGLQVKFSDPSLKQKRDLKVDQGREVFIRGLPFDVAPKEIENLLRELTNPLSVRVPLGKSGQKNNGIAFLDFSSEQEAQIAIKELDGQDIVGRRISAVVARRKPDSRRSTSNLENTIVFENLKGSMATLMNMLDPYGQFDVEAKGEDVLVTFAKTQDAGKALLALQGKEFNGVPLSIRNLGQREMRPRNV